MNTSKNAVGDTAWLKTSSRFASLGVDPAIGNIRELTFSVDGRSLTPLHSAPWVNDSVAITTDDEGTPPVEQRLSGDFLCAPFGASDVIECPPHGWTANSRWLPAQAAQGCVAMTLERQVMGASISKRMCVDDEAPLLYQEHIIEGGEGGLTLAHHPMVRVAGKGTLSMSSKQAFLSAATPLEPNRHALACGAVVTDPARLPAAAGSGFIDIGALPIAERCEDFLVAVETPARALGWTAVVRHQEDDIVFFLKDPSVLPITMFWHSNAGRDYSPWNGRHTGVIGIEDGCAAGVEGHRAALGRNTLSSYNIPTALDLEAGRQWRIAHVTGCMPRPAHWQRVIDIHVEENIVRLTGQTDTHRTESRDWPFRSDFFAGHP